MSGVVQNQDSYMKGKIAQRWYYDQVAPALAEAFALFREKTGRQYDFLLPYRCEDAEYVLVGMGSYMETAEVTVDYLREQTGIKAGCLTVYCFRRFPMHEIVDATKHCQAITVFERMDDPLSTTGNHLTREIKAAFCDAHERPDGPRRRSTACRGSTMRRPGWAAATCGPATSSPPSENMIDAAARFLLRGSRPSAGAARYAKIPTCGPPAGSPCVGTASAASAR